MIWLPVHAAGAIRKATMREFDAICPSGHGSPRHASAGSMLLSGSESAPAELGALPQVRSYGSFLLPGPSAGIPRIRYSYTDVAPSFQRPAGDRAGLQPWPRCNAALSQRHFITLPAFHRGTAASMTPCDLGHVPRSFRAAMSDGLTALDSSGPARPCVIERINFGADCTRCCGLSCRPA
jgi:hypothetical protein